MVITGLTRNQFASNRTWVRIPHSPAEKNPHLSTTSVGSFQLNPPYRVGEIIFDDEIPYGDEIRLDGGRVDLISSAKQISSERCSDFIAPRAISLKYPMIYDIISSINENLSNGLYL